MFTCLQDGDLLIGAPGPYNWRGAVFKNRIMQLLNESESARWYQSPVEDPLPGAEEMPDPATGYYSYLGCYSLCISFCALSLFIIIIIIMEKTEAGLERPLYPRNR